MTGPRSFIQAQTPAPVPRVDDEPRGICSGVINDEVWFTDTDDAIDEARATCLTCPIRSSCLTYAIEYGEEGNWAGTTEAQRKCRTAHDLLADPSRTCAKCDPKSVRAKRRTRADEPGNALLAEATFEAWT